MSTFTDRLHASWLRQNASDRSFHWLVVPRHPLADNPCPWAGVSGAAAPDVKPTSRKVPSDGLGASPARLPGSSVLPLVLALPLHGVGSGAGLARAGAALAPAQTPLRALKSLPPAA